MNTTTKILTTRNKELDQLRADIHTEIINVTSNTCITLDR